MAPVARRPVKIKIRPKRPKPDTSHMLRTDADGFTHNEWLEALIRCRDEQPRRYEREISAGMKVTVGKYEEAKKAHERKAQSQKGKGTARPSARRVDAAAASTRRDSDAGRPAAASSAGATGRRVD